MIDDDPENDTLRIFPEDADLSVFDDFEATVAHALRAMTTAAKNAVAENDRLGIPSWSRDGDDLVARLNGREVERRRWRRLGEAT